MGYERYPRGNEPRRGYEGRDDDGRDAGGADDRQGYAAARDYGAGDYDRTEEQRHYGAPRGTGWSGNDRGSQNRGFSGGPDYYRGGDRSFLTYGGQSQAGQGYGDRDFARDPYRQARGTYNRRPQAFNERSHDDRDDTDRGFFERAGDEVRSWFGDEEAERRREADARRDEPFRNENHGRDDHYSTWRNQQIAAFDRDYDEYRRENQSKFHNEFSTFRTERQGQRDLLGRVEEHANVVGSDGEHIGTVDKVRGDRIILTKSDADAGGRHHSVPSRWLQSAEGNTVTLRKTAAEAKAHWRDEERNGALFGENGEQRQADTGTTNLNRSFSGTY